MDTLEMIIKGLGILNIIYFIGFVVIIIFLVKTNKKIKLFLKQKELESTKDTLFTKHGVYAQEKYDNQDGLTRLGKENVDTGDRNEYLVSDNDRPQIVIRTKSVYEPKQLEKPILYKNVKNEEVPRYLIFDNYSIRKLRKSLDWGEKTQRNQVEQGGILLGNIALYKNEIYCFVKDILLAKTKGMPSFVEFTSEMWKDMQNELVVLNETKLKDEKLIILGWFHTHPNNLSVFMSGTDMETQRLNFPLKWQVSLVMNPHKNIYRAFFGKDAAEGNIIFSEEQI